MNVLSVDLAHTAYDRLGVVLLEEQGRIFQVRRLTPDDLGLSACRPNPSRLAVALSNACERLPASLLILDGPQAWKDPANGLQHSRVCERRLNTPGKTGLPGHATPKNYLPFIAFSIAVFQHLVALGFELWTGRPTTRPLVLESFPSSAWRSLGLAPLPAKAKASPKHLQDALVELRGLFPIQVEGPLSHDETQALVAAPAGVAVARGCQLGFTSAGTAPSLREDIWYEGFIVNPTRKAFVPCA